MNILIYGEGNQYGVALPLKKAFEQIGHKATIFDWPQYLYTSRQYSLKNRFLDRVLFHNIARKINRDIINAFTKERYDLLVVIRGNHIFPTTILTAKKYIPHIINWNSDDFFNPLNSSSYILQSFDKYDCIFTSRGHLEEEYLRKGAKRFEVLNWYYRPDMLFSKDRILYKSYLRDIVFIGSWSKRRENILSSLQEFNLAIWGGSWRKTEKTFRKKKLCHDQIYMEEMIGVLASSRIALNILTKENRDTTNIRNFEIPACGAFQLCERSDAILEIFEEDKEIVCFETTEELLSKCEYYLHHEAERDEIRINGYNRLINGNHSIIDRAKEILVTLSL